LITNHNPENQYKILVDFGHLSIRALFASRSVSKEKYKEIFINITLKMLNKIVLRFKINPSNVILALEGKNNWRRDVDPLYKIQRKINRNKDDINWEEYFNLVNNLIDALDTGTMMKTIKVDRCEGDDIIGALAKYIQDYENTNVIIASSDKDFKQLIDKKIAMYDGMKDILFISEDYEFKDEISEILNLNNISTVSKKTGMKNLLRGLI